MSGFHTLRAASVMSTEAGATVAVASEKSVAIVSRSSAKASGVGSSMRRFSSPWMILKCMVVVVSFIVS